MSQPPPPEVASKALNGAQTQSLITVMQQFAGGLLTEGQATNLISRSIGVSKQEAGELLSGKVD